jgi:hypothetical protein
LKVRLPVNFLFSASTNTAHAGSGNDEHTATGLLIKAKEPKQNVTPKPASRIIGSLKTVDAPMTHT